MPLQQEGEFYAALCYDMNITPDPIKFLGTEQDEIYSNPRILQRERETFLKFLEVVALDVDNEEITG